MGPHFEAHKGAQLFPRMLAPIVPNAVLKHLLVMIVQCRGKPGHDLSRHDEVFTETVNGSIEDEKNLDGWGGVSRHVPHSDQLTTMTVQE